MEEIRSLESRVLFGQTAKTPGGGATSQFWEEKFLAEEKARKTVESMKRAEEEKVIELQAQLSEMLEKLKQFQSKDTQRHRLTTGDSTGAASKTTNSEPKAFYSTLQKMAAGSEVQQWQKDSYQKVFISLSPDFSEISFASAPKKKPFEIS